MPSKPHLNLLSRASPLRTAFRPHILQPRPPFSVPPKRLASQWPPSGYPQRPRYNRFNNARNVYSLWQRSPTFRSGTGIAILAGGVFIYANLERVPVSGRLRFNVCSPETEARFGQAALQGVLQEFSGKVLPPSHPYSRQVNRVLQRLIPQSGYEGAEWDIKVIHDDEQKNAFVMPGGKVFVFSGILPICAGDDGLAAVLGHEIAHQTAHHTAEKISQQLYIPLLSIALAVFGDVSGQFAQILIDLALSRPFSRSMESEADFIGLLMMAQACYDPRAAVGLWERMAKAEEYAPPQFLSTHPASKNRITRIQGWLPQAEEKRSESQCRATISYGEEFKKAFGGGVGEEIW